MPRANRHYLPGHIWHITHRCHQKQFLLRFARDRPAWLGWLFEAGKRFGLSVLNYVTSNHVHLLVVDGKEVDTIPNSVQLIAGRTGQQYNQRKQRRGALWEDGYHATAVESGEHLIQCLVYMDLNMLRAGVVGHPEQWPFAGYREIQNPKQRYGIISYERLIELLGMKDLAGVQESCKGEWKKRCAVSDNAGKPSGARAIAVGSEHYVGGIQRELGGEGQRPQGDRGRRKSSITGIRNGIQTPL